MSSADVVIGTLRVSSIYNPHVTLVTGAERMFSA